MRAATLHRWSVVHTWSSLACTVFLLAICLTGLPLVFSEEIAHLTDAAAPYPMMAVATPRADADTLLERARQAYPGDVIHSLYWPEDQPAAVVTLAPADMANGGRDHTITFDARTGLERKRATLTGNMTFMDVMGHIHEDLFLDLPGELFLGAMAVLFVIAIVSGVVLYAPFMRHVRFGQRRAAPGSRLAWLDLHNVQSAVTLLWMGVLGITGVINELATPLYEHWLATDVAAVRAPGAHPVPAAQLASVSAAIRAVEARLPGRTIETVDFPANTFGSPGHLVVWTKGNSPFTSRIYIPAFVAAATGTVVMAKPLPWYLFVLEVARPLHFGDYGGLPLKALWAAFDVLTLIVLVSGLELWWSRWRSHR